MFEKTLSLSLLYPIYGSKFIGKTPRSLVTIAPSQHYLTQLAASYGMLGFTPIMFSIASCSECHSVRPGSTSMQCMKFLGPGQQLTHRSLYPHGEVYVVS